jgi:hypothetical protein
VKFFLSLYSVGRAFGLMGHAMYMEIGSQASRNSSTVLHEWRFDTRRRDWPHASVWDLYIINV